MARLARIVLPGHSVHIIQRGNNRQAVFFAEEDYHNYLRTLGEAAAEGGCAIHAYALMTNHIHLLTTPAHENSLSLMMQSLGGRYVRYINRIYQRSGSLWEGRFKSSLIDSDRYLLICSRYIELNPVRAGMVDTPQDYPWSSYHRNALGHDDAIITPHFLYKQPSDSKTTNNKPMEIYSSHTLTVNP
jgi:REP-associated tyrosine transposase